MENWIKWKPLATLAPKYYIESISDNINEFKVILSESEKEENKIQIIFKDSVYAYRSTYESFRIKRMNKLDEQYGSEFYSRWTFFKITNSQYLQWLSSESCEITNNLNLIHFTIVAVDSILDIVTTYEPKVEIVNK